MEVFPLGDSAIVVRVGTSIDEATHRRVRALCARLDAHPVPGMIAYVPAFASVTVHYAPARVGSPPGAQGTADATPYARVAAALERLLEGLDATEPPAGRVVDIPVVYGGSYGPDLDAVAVHAGMSPDEVVDAHVSGDYRVYMIGFAPGFPYLAGLPERLAAPRRPTPRTAVPAGSVGIAGRQTGIYPIESPGGWQIIGRTPARLFSPDRDPPTLLRVGDRVRFHAIAPDAWERAAAAWPDPSPEPGPAA
ncbi:MAG TPA: 5-oxoprolinase subunit PxpB [Longimicrobiales bacterium]